MPAVDKINKLVKVIDNNNPLFVFEKIKEKVKNKPQKTKIISIGKIP